MTAESDFARKVTAWQRRAGRHDLPWQKVADPYRVWLSEIMLQQTQVNAVVPYFDRFLKRFPTLQYLAEADEDDVLAVWSGLGYYARARNLHRAARQISRINQGQFPTRFDDIVALPGVGRSTAGAIAVFSFGQRHPILDGNVKRVFARYFAIEGYPGVQAVANRLWRLAEQLLPERNNVQAYTQGLMDLGAQVCTRSRPRCQACPLAQSCAARLQDRIDRLPTPRPKKVRPQRSTVMLVMEYCGRLMMEKRPASGIWGGLWSFPEIDAADDARQACRGRFGAEVRTIDQMTTIEHGFTHFSLTISPLLCEVKERRPQAEMPGRTWVGLDEAMHYPIPVPVRKLVSQLRARLGLQASPDQAG
ncbi:MAG: A/G-specific adenine glycosylase [Betaproteobacteria bacterium]|nr:MAG: A/G-specific adenine glycosylase [Betaproteobacteria bacterium]